ncbi:MAG: hypothetical protein NXH95_13555 [Pseudomonadaceae bacterium]|nr:hypothetical protein [Pseudomonadaceae bacterium]
MEELFTGTFGTFLLFAAVIWGVLLFFSPFFWYGTNMRAREAAKHLERLVQLKEHEMKTAAEFRKKLAEGEAQDN